MASFVLFDLLNLHRLPPGRRIYGLRRTRALVEPNDPLATTIDESISHDQAVLEMLTKWQKARKETQAWPQEVLDLDREHDRLWGALENGCKAFGALADSEAGASAAHIRETLFVDGLAALVQVPFVEQREKTEAWLGRLRGDLAKDVEKAGLKAIADRLSVVNKRFGELIDERKSAELSYSQVREADVEGQRKLFGVVARIIGREADRDAERQRLLGPIFQQHDELSELYRRRRKVTDVDPDSGEPIVEPVQPVSG